MREGATRRRSITFFFNKRRRLSEYQNSGVSGSFPVSCANSSKKPLHCVGIQTLSRSVAAIKNRYHDTHALAQYALVLFQRENSNSGYALCNAFLNPPCTSWITLPLCGTIHINKAQQRNYSPLHLSESSNRLCTNPVVTEGRYPFPLQFCQSTPCSSWNLASSC